MTPTSPMDPSSDASDASIDARGTTSSPTTEVGAPTRPRPPAGRSALSRERIVDAAIRLIDTEGVAALTMRRLGAALDVEAMSLYRYVNGREDLLEAVVDALVDSIRIPAPGQLEPVDGWQAFLQWLAHDVRRLALEHPAAFPLIATRHPAAPWLRPPLRSLRVVEAFLEGLRARGFRDEQAVAAYRTFTSFLLGHLLLESAMQGAELSPAEEPLDEGDADLPNRDQDLDLTDFPALTRLRGQLTEDHTEEEFEAALEHLLVRLDLELAQ
ncbi:TetR/AcrR family transcriptional regulator C-terminal domain-containing protein [Terrabacter terrae]|uniref:TetR/AcrR family transcriptional regulator C-terminal domain-containing protein n=1 Tax=Terrabacter terrae TaxID=318434 RepID=A0ABP5G580_9MICO